MIHSVSEDLLCAFELLKPLDGAALRKEMTKAKRKRFVGVCLSAAATTNSILQQRTPSRLDGLPECSVNLYPGFDHDAFDMKSANEYHERW
jgi:hypothetical protein